MNGYCYGIALVGLQGHRVKIEVRRSQGIPAFNLVGLPDTSLREARCRVEAAISALGISWESARITVNLSPGELPKAGTSFDLGIALAVLASKYQQMQKNLADTAVIGELGLDGGLRGTRGILPQVMAAREMGFVSVIVPAELSEEARLIEGIRIIPAVNLLQVALERGLKLTQKEQDRLCAQGRVNERGEYLFTSAEKILLSGNSAPASFSERNIDEVDLAQVRGAKRGKFALEVAAAGGHNLFFHGVPGSGKTMLAKCLPTILPPLPAQAALELNALRSLAGVLSAAERIETQAPFVAPHHSASLPALVGGGSGTARPGAISLAHQGVLFLDEAYEFSPKVLDSLRQPLETGRIMIHRQKSIVEYPAAFQLVLAANPCPCGGGETCRCSSTMKMRYQNRLSGPIRDRIDIFCEVMAPSLADLGEEPDRESSPQVRERVVEARKIQAERWQNYPWKINAQASAQALKKVITLPCRNFLDTQVARGRISLRGADRSARLALTLSDLSGSSQVTKADVEEAIALRAGK